MGWIGRCLVLVALAVALVPVAADAGQARRDTVVIGAAQEPACLMTVFAGCTLAIGAAVNNSLFVSMVEFNHEWKLNARLVEKIPSLRDGDWELLPEKKMRVTYRFKRGYTWHDGRPVSALDTSWTYLMLRNPRTPTASRFVLRKIDHMLVPNPNNPYTLVVQWNERYPFANLGHTTYPKHVLEREYQQNPTGLSRHRQNFEPVGNGPYRFVEWARGSHITLEAYDGFKEGRAKIRRIVFRFILDATVLQANAIAGQVDVTEINNFDCTQVAEIERRNPAVQGHYTPALIWEHVDFNLDHEWLRDRRVRHALIHALNRQQLAELACPGGRQPVAHTWLPERHEAFNPNVKKYDYNLERARALLREAGFTPGPDGILRDAQGRRFELTIMTTAGNALREQVQQVMREQLRQVGVDLRIDNRPASVLFGQVTARRQFPHLVMYAWVMSPTTLPAALWHSTQIPRPENNWEGQNIPGWRNAENDRLIDQIMEEIDTQRRIRLFRRQQELWVEDLPSIPLYFRLSLTTSARALRNVKPAGLAGTYINWNSEQWEWAQ
ncbi:MAG: peptide ABC transporter substrate-binding protein [Armatimonadota bacterium]|nr:peptide ABC transporter substrate-binding protein [Armatimonadota bacterium]MDR7459699.1 peptide ABC transporter substrate-binding protein [Armatimonadota bacterium]MDR7478291.1 peptide ABC transporter substrate-binding protein [Armatimonadota bacterium]